MGNNVSSYWVLVSLNEENHLVHLSMAGILFSSKFKYQMYATYILPVQQSLSSGLAGIFIPPTVMAGMAQFVLLVLEIVILCT